MDPNKIIKQLIKQSPFTQAHWARKLDFDTGKMSKIINGQQPLQFSEVEKIATVFNMSVVDFLFYPDKYVKVDSNKEESKKKLLIEIELTDEDFVNLGLAEKIIRVIEQKK